MALEILFKLLCSLNVWKFEKSVQRDNFIETKFACCLPVAYYIVHTIASNSFCKLLGQFGWSKTINIAQCNNGQN